MSTRTEKLGLLKPELSDPANITAMNENWDKLDQLASADYVVEAGEITVDNSSKGTSDVNWQYRKWNSGRVEFWGSTTINDVVIDNIVEEPGSAYSSYISLLLPFNTTSDIFAICTHAGAGVWISQYYQYSHDKINIRANTLQPCTRTIHPRIYAWSTWK